jgi:hypothetical protein
MYLEFNKQIREIIETCNQGVLKCIFQIRSLKAKLY